MATIFGFLYMGAQWRHLKNTTKPSMCGGDAALCQISLTTCYYTVCLFKARLDKFWMHQDVLYDFTADLTGIGDRSVRESS